MTLFCIADHFGNAIGLCNKYQSCKTVYLPVTEHTQTGKGAGSNSNHVSELSLDRGKIYVTAYLSMVMKFNDF